MTLFGKLYNWVELRLGISQVIEKEMTGYLLPRTINSWYSLGSVLLFAFALQVVSGILLLIYYVPDADKAFKSVSVIMNEIPFGWLIRLSHAVGSNLMVAALFLHMFSVLFLGSYKKPRELQWVSGFTLLNLVMGISLTGYLLPWSQLSFWATTVATNSVGAVPVIGEFLVEFIRGGKLVGPPTLGRFFAIHVALLPLVIAGLIAAHLFFLKRTGISTPPTSDTATAPQLGNSYRYEKHEGGIPFFPNFFLHDMSSVAIYVACLLGVVYFSPYLFFTPDSFVPANPFQTPAHIKPEWYFLANYQILKIFPSEIIGLTVQGGAMTIIALLPFVDRGDKRYPLKRPLFMACAIGGIALFLALSIWGHLS